MENLSSASLFGFVLVGNLFATVLFPLVFGFVKGEKFSRRSKRAIKLSTMTAIKTSPATAIFTRIFMQPILLEAMHRAKADSIEIVSKWFLLLAIGDATYYFLHRLFHIPFLYQFHAEHHTFTPQFTLATNAVGILDALVTVVFGMVMVPFLVVPNPPIETIVLYISTLIVMGNHIHSSENGTVDIFPFTNPGEHAVHHRFGGPQSFNFGGLTTIWDRLLGTYKPAGYKRSLVSRASASESDAVDFSFSANSTELLVGKSLEELMSERKRYTIRIFSAGVLFLAMLLAPRRPEQVVNGKVVLDAQSMTQPAIPLLIEIVNVVADPFKEMLVPLTEDSIIGMAISRSGGLQSFYGDNEKLFPKSFGEYWRIALGLILEDIDERKEGKERNFFGRIIFREQLVNALVAQLQVVNMIENHPEILQRDLGDIAILGGLPRTGSTALHQMICEHPDTRCLHFFESLQPVSATVPIPERSVDPRVLVGKIGAGLQIWLRPWVSAMFPLTSEVAFEEVFVTAHVMSSWQLVFGFSGHKYWKWYLETDHTPAYQYVKAVYQVMDYQSNIVPAPGTIRVMKSPQHMVNLQEIKNVFPNAKMVMTSRDMVPVVESFTTLVAYGMGASFKRVDLQILGHNMVNLLDKGLDLALKTSFAPLPVHYIEFEDFAKNSSYVTSELLRGLGLRDVDPLVLSKALPPRQGAMKLKYSLSSFGLSAKMISDKLDSKRQKLTHGGCKLEKLAE